MKSLRALVVVAVFASFACFRGGLLPAIIATAIITDVAVHSAPPPPPREIVVAPQPGSGYVWQPGYWSYDNNQWMWIEGHWARAEPGYIWVPAHWEHASDNTWQLIPGRWVSDAPR